MVHFQNHIWAYDKCLATRHNISSRNAYKSGPDGGGRAAGDRADLELLRESHSAPTLFPSLRPSVRPSVGSPPRRSALKDEICGECVARPSTVRRPICRFLTRGHFLACSLLFLSRGGFLGCRTDCLLLIWPTEEESGQNSAAPSHNSFTAERKIILYMEHLKYLHKFLSDCVINHAHCQSITYS